MVHGSFGKDGPLQPFAREIMLLECQIAGATHRDIKHVEPSLVPGCLLSLKREPTNEHDHLTVMIFNEAGAPLGYVPRAKNEVIARLMDAGKLLFARLGSKEWQGDWLRAEVQIFLRDH